jgi:acetyl-CoA carboxylase biotin carboxylase subunit
MIEEAPSPVLTPELRARMGQAAVAAAEAVDYRNAGTIEFLYQDGDFYFLEMNTRIQVEHPVTELVTGIDLVQWQLRVAGGERLAFTQEDVAIKGHAIECRITSEDPAHGFLPSTGHITLVEPPTGPGVRWDSGIHEGSEISLYYDPMLAKLITYADDREAAIERMLRALSELTIVGVETSMPFHMRVMREPDFRAGKLDIRYLENHPAVAEPSLADEDARLAAIAAALLEDEERRRRSVTRVAPQAPANGSRWLRRGWK